MLKLLVRPQTLWTVAALVSTSANFTTYAAPAAGSEWEQAALAAIASSEYHFTDDGAGGYSAPNRTQGLRVAIDASGLNVTSRAGGSHEFKFALRFDRIECTDVMHSVGPGTALAERDEARIERDGLVESFTNESAGLEHQLFVAYSPCAREGVFVLAFSLTGDVLAEPLGDARGVLLRDAGGRVRARYGNLAVFDATHRVVPARLDPAPGALRIEIDDRGAVYPLTVDPLLTSAAWTASGGQADARLGFALSVAGDVDGNGYSDVIVGAPQFDNGQLDEGRAFLFLGSASGLASNAAWTVEADQANAQLGSSIAAAGDVNGDGYGDVAVGAPLYDGTLSDKGRVLVYLGSATGLGTSPATTLSGGQASAQFGSSVARAGDVNGDGFDDLIAGAPLRDNGETDEGRALVYLGSAGGLSSTASWSVELNQAGARFGATVATAGDVNADGYADVIVGAPLQDNGQTDEGRAFVYHGSSTGLSMSAAWSVESDLASAEMGRSVGTAGDVNGDGYGDVIVGVPLYDNGQADEGRVLVYHGSATGLSTTAAFSIESDQASAELGRVATTAGDVNGDGFADVLIGAPLFDNGQTDEGRAWVYQGSAAGLVATAAWSVESDQAAAELGRSGAAAGDVNGDGFSDVIVGIPKYDGTLIDEGRAALYLGAGDGLAATAGWTAKGNQPGAYFGYSVAAAGDVNGDGYGDVLVGAYLYDNGQTDEGRAYLYLGSAAGLAVAPAWTSESDQAGAHYSVGLASAGDVNGDGYDDVIVGSPYYSGPMLQEGRAYLFLGSASGLTVSPAWTGENNQADSRFGVSVAGAGDVNGDGYADVLVGAVFFDGGETDEGRAYLYLGSPQGLGSAPSWITDGDQPLASYAFSVSGAGDVNGDGYGDLLVGSRLYTNGQKSEGRVYCYHGSSTGPATSPSWTVESNLANANLSTSIAAAGDVNGDGFGDVVLGAPGLSNGESGEGRAYVYFGSASGLAANAAWTAESNQAGASFGRTVYGAGDVNGDGFDDLVIGAPGFDNGQADEGRAFIYLGSATGPASTPALTIEPDLAGSSLGLGVARAGDVNGDGFSDVIVGAYLLSNPNTNEGKTFVHYGGGGDGLDRAPRQIRVSGTAPVGLYGKADSPTSFKLRALGRTAAGRGSVRIESELKAQAAPFDGTSLTRSTYRDTGAPGLSGSVYSSFDETITGLSGSLSKWRLRLAAKDPAFPRSPWLFNFENPRTQGDLRSNACTTATFYVDSDADGYGNVAMSQQACDQPAGYVRNAADCNDGNAQIWSAPGEVQKLTIASNKQLVQWLAPGDLGGQPATLLYDTLRATSPTGFVAGICVESNDGVDTAATDTTLPTIATAVYYLVRAENSCPSGLGTLGKSSAGTPRSGRSCP